MDADKWLTLPDDLLVDIFRRLDVTAVIRCAASCRPWRHTIIDNASRLRSRPDRFLPDLLLGFLDKRHSRSPKRLQYVPKTNTAVPSLFTPGTTGVGVSVDGSLYNNLLSSRDGFLLLGESKSHKSRLCLCTALTGACNVLPAAALLEGSSVGVMYVLATGYDVDDNESAVSDSDGGDKTSAVWILAVKWLVNSRDGMIYQIFSSKSGAWGPVKCAAKFPEDVDRLYTNPSSSKGAVVVWPGAVSWLVLLLPSVDAVNARTRKCMFSVDLRTERTWTTELPDSCTVEDSLVPAVFEDNQLSLVKVQPSSHQMEVWVLVGDDQWMLRWTIDDVQKVLPNCPSMGKMSLSGFCPRSGYLFGTGRDDDRDLLHHFLIGVDGSSARLIGTVKSSSRPTPIRFPYEMDWSAYIWSYISKMRYF